jgi:6-pyruvoyltetrahydropterin/6-carboxytetrahydropterin synthase
MPYRICKTVEVESGHMLSKHPDNCKFPHGHSRKVEILLEADELDQNDMVCDFAVIKDAIREFVHHYDHAMCVNTEDPKFDEMRELYGDRVIGFPGVDPTTEVMAKTIFDAIKSGLEAYMREPDPKYPLGQSVRLVRIRAWETSTCWAEYSE